MAHRAGLFMLAFSATRAVEALALELGPDAL